MSMKSGNGYQCKCGSYSTYVRINKGEIVCRSCGLVTPKKELPKKIIKGIRCQCGSTLTHIRQKTNEIVCRSCGLVEKLHDKD
jgi:transcription initiation factor TFIIIB Brf1 subunit/transcription initiation factor TFIIB